MGKGGSNKLIYKNTLIIYVRMIIVTFVGLLSSRFVLQALGASDYGLYNVVGGLVAMLNFIVTAMASTTRRFVNVEMGKPDGDLNKVFNISLLLHIGFAAFILIVAESIGVWYINNYLNVAPGKEADAMFVFQFSTIIACLGIINVPYQSLIEAHEKFSIAAIIDVSTTLVRFGLIFVLLYYQGNLLRFYALLMCGTSLLSFSLFHLVCFRKWPDIIKHRLYKKSPLYKEMLSFNGYTALGAAASIGKSQGTNLIVNYFFGTIVNAAFAVAYHVESHVYMFVNKLTIAANPQVIRNYASDNSGRVNYLVQTNSRYCILIMTLMFFPLISEIEFVLDVWLKDVPDGAVLLCSLTLIQALITSFSEGTNGFVQASGKIKWFQIVGSVILLLNLPIGILLFSMGFEAYWVVVVYIIMSVINRIVTLIMMSKILKFDTWNYVRKAYVRPLVVIALMTAIILAYRLLPIESWPLHLLGLIIIFIVTSVFVFFVGLISSERESIVSKIKMLLKKKKKAC